jgi:predicted Zn-dependent protease
MAFDVLDAAMAAYPDNLDFPLHKAAALLARGTARSLTDARALLDDVTRRDSARIEAWMMLAQAALADGSPDSALEAVARGMGLAPAAAARRRLLMLKADAEKARWPALAAATLRGLWEENRADAAAATALAQALRSAADADGAVSVLQSLRKGAQGDAAVALDLAIADCMSAGGRVDAALAAVREAAPAGDPRVALVSCLILARAGRWDQAVSTLAAWQAAHPDDAGTLLAAARAFMETVPPNPARAKEVLEMVASRHGDKPAVLAALAAACQAAGEIDRAEDLYRRVLDSSASDPMALNNLAWILCEDRRRPADALPLADKGRALYPEMADMADTRAVIYHRLGRHSDAERELRFCLDQAAPGSTASAVARLHLSRLLIGRERGAEAVPVLKDLFSKPQLVAALGAAERAEAEAMRQTLGFAPAL